jgi:hypothetical protein
MGADNSRVRRNPLLDYAGVELQQGRVLLDGDFNELVAVIDRRLRALASDTLGRATVSSTTPDAFKLAVSGGTLTIQKGRLYVDGMLAENHGAVSTTAAKQVFDDLLGEPSFTDAIAYTAQPYLPSAPVLPTAGKHLVYLDVWQREVTPLERPDLIESAVNVDTSTRLQTVWQVRVLPDAVGNTSTCASPDADLDGWSTLIAPSTGVLTTGTFDVAAVDDPCELPPTGGYRGLENQLYRVEIHEAGKLGAATFKWSRENASVGTRITSVISGTELEVETLGRDDVLRISTGDWVEITNDARELSQAAGEMRRVTVTDATRRITFSPPLPASMLPPAAPPPQFPSAAFPTTTNLRLRRWDQSGKVFRTDSSGTPVEVQDLDSGTTGVIKVPAAGTTLLLENGVTISFDSTGSKGFRAGDHWEFAARTSDASVEPLTRAAPRGIHHHYARLGIWDIDAANVADCRHPWPPQGEGDDCSCTACVSPESHANGSFTIQDAVVAVQQTGGTVCLGPGQYALRDAVRLTNARSLRIRGHGPSTVISAPGTAFALQHCGGITIEDLSILSLGQQSAISVTTVLGLSLQRLLMLVPQATDSSTSAISLSGVVAGANIRENVIVAPTGVLALDPASAPPVGNVPPPTFLLTAALAIENNDFLCQSSAVTLDGMVLHVMSTRIADNEILGCTDVALSTLGIGASGSAMIVRGNNCSVSGSGIRCGVDGLWIADNRIARGPSRLRRDLTIGIALEAGLDKDGPGECQILSNQISGFGLAGVAIAAPTRDLIIKMNIIERCGNGILSLDRGSSAALAIENNQLRDIGPLGDDTGADVIGIGVVRSESATVAGNQLNAIAVEAQNAGLRAGILLLGTMRSRVAGNDVTDLAPPLDRGGDSAAIAVSAPFLEFEVSNNHIRRDSVPNTGAGKGDWLALRVGADVDAQQQQQAVTRTGQFTTVVLDDTRSLVLGEQNAFIWAAPVAAAENAVAESPSGAVLGNRFVARGPSPAVFVAAPGECLFNDNRVDAATRGPVAVLLRSNVLIVNANRVRSTSELSIAIQSKLATVVGNVTSGAITPLAAPWDVLNLRG